MTTCTLCNRAAVTKGLCRMHYMRQRRHGDPRQVDKAGRPRKETPGPHRGTDAGPRIPEDKKNAELVKEAIDKEHKKLLADFREQLKAEREKWLRFQKEANDEKLRYEKLTRDFTTVMTYEQFSLIRNCLHPDRPERSVGKLTKAFAIFNRLETMVNKRLPIATLRERGWAHVSPFYKRKKKPAP